MTTAREQLDIIRKLSADDGHYPPMAYCFVKEAVHRAIDEMEEKKKQQSEETASDIPGAALTHFIRRRLLNQYGPFAIDILDLWNIRCTQDFGKIVYQMVSVGLLGKSEKDSLDDFKDVFDFTEAFVLPYRKN